MSEIEGVPNMGRVTVDACDSCGATRVSGNHWFRVAPSDNSLTISPHNAEDPLMEGAILACGEKCVQRLVSAYLAGKHLPRANQHAQPNQFHSRKTKLRAAVAELSTEPGEESEV
jgi:hypothetical protein